MSNGDRVDLEKLKGEIEALGEKVKQLKQNSPDSKDAIKASVDELLAAKQKYADNNGGLGVDGKPFEVKSSKADKKAKAKAEKGDAVAAGGPAKQAADPNSAGAQKKAAKKAAKKAQKAAHKEQGGDCVEAPKADPAIAPVAESSKPQSKSTQAPTTVAGTTQATTPVPMTAPAQPAIVPVATANLESLQVSINPNVPLCERPVVAMSIAVLTDTAVDLDIISNHKLPCTAMGVEVPLATDTTAAPVVTGDVAMARYLLRRAVDKGKNNSKAGMQPRAKAMAASFQALLSTENPAKQALIDAWVDYAQSLQRLSNEQRMNAVALSVEHTLRGAGERTYLVGSALSMADLCLFQTLGFPTSATDRAELLNSWPEQAIAGRRWILALSYHPALQEATQLCLGIANNMEAVFDDDVAYKLDPLVSGMNLLQAGTPGRIVTRFPPEPSGYLHIGHAKAVLLNDYYASRYKGRLIVRFDDTNPSKEKEEFQESIVADLALLGVKPNLVTYTSDYFSVIEGYAKQLIADGLAYMDDTPQEQMKTERAAREESKNRKQSPEDALKYFQLMCSGSPEGASWCLRARIDMQSDNGTLRDPVLYRGNTENAHHRTGTTFKAYPTYDLACPIVDSIEGVTHALRTTEYNDRDAQYQWLLQALGLRRVRIHAFSRVNFKHTVLSKRKLTWFVDNGRVTGWDDARMPTIRGVKRRGLHTQALRNFMYSQGASRRVVLMDWTAFWSENKKEIDKTAKRFMAVDKEQNVSLKIDTSTDSSAIPTESDWAFVETDVHPKDSSLGKRSIRISNEVLLETVDVQGMTVGEDIVLLRWGVVKITDVTKDGDAVKGLRGTFVPNGDFRAAKKKLSWIANVNNNATVVLTEFDNLISKEKLEEEDNFQDFINPDTMATTQVIGDAGLKALRHNEIIQLERRGYFRVDRPFINDSSKPLILFMIPDGKSKAMSGQTTKLAHR